MRGLALAVVLLALCAVSLAGTLPAETDPTAGIILKPGVYDAHWTVPKARLDDGTNMLAGEAQLSLNRPKAVKACPGFKSGRPVFGFIEFHGSSDNSPRPMLMALDESRGTGKGYDTLYLDADRDLDLQNDHPQTGTRTKDDMYSHAYRVAFISAAEMPYDKLTPGSPAKHRVVLDAYVHDWGIPPISAQVRIRGCWSGQVNSNKGAIPFIVQDWNLNGRFGDPWSNFPPRRSAGDLVRFAWLRDGNFGGRFSYYSTNYLAASVASMNGRLFTLIPSSDGAKLEVSRYTGPSGRLALKLLKVGVTTLKPVCPTEDVTGQSGKYTLPTAGPGVELPTGRYYVQSVWVRGAQMKPLHWTFDYDPFELYAVHTGKTTSVTIGGKISLQIAPGEKEIVLKRGSRSDVRVPTLLPGGQAVVQKNGEYMLPVVKLIDASGKVVYKGDVNKRDYWLRDLKEIPTSLKPGTYTMKVTVDVGPFGGKLSASKKVVVK